MPKSFTIYGLPKEERPRERLVTFGEQALSAQKLLTQFGSLQKLAEADLNKK